MSKTITEQAMNYAKDQRDRYFTPAPVGENPMADEFEAALFTTFVRGSIAERQQVADRIIAEAHDAHRAIDHIDGDIYNNDPSNLRIVTLSNDRR